MDRRTTAIIGAGAVLDFDFNGLIKPTTVNITKAVVQQKIQGFDGGDSELIQQIYNLIFEASRKEYLKFHPAVRRYEPMVTFEELFEVIETLYSYNYTWNHEHFPFPLVSALIKSDLHYTSIEYYRALIAIIERIFEIVSK